MVPLQHNHQWRVRIGAAVIILLLAMFATKLFLGRSHEVQLTETPWAPHERVQPLGGIGAALLPQLPSDLPPDNVVTPEQLARIDTLKMKLRRRYNIDIRVFEVASIEQRFGLHAVAYAPHDIEIYLAALGTWLAKYPPFYIARSGIRTVYLFDQWRYGNIRAAGFLIGDDAIGITGDEEVLHHELWHVADAFLTLPDDNERWLRAKFGKAPPDGIESLSGLRALQQNLHLQERPFGYVSAYGKYAGVDEDQATTASMLLTDSPTLSTLMRKEPPLRSGVRYLQAFFAEQSEDRMDRTYWDDLSANMAITEKYWRL